MKKVICILLIIVMVSITPINALAVSAVSEDAMTIQEVTQDFNYIRELYSQRRLLRRKSYTNDVDNNSVSSYSVNDEISAIDEQLEHLGVRKVNVMGAYGSGDMSMLAVTEEENETWSEKTYSSVYSGGVRYEVRVLTAESANVNSVLYDSSSKIIHAAPGVAAGTADYLRIYGVAASGVVGTVFGTIYDAVSTTISNLKTSTIIENVSATYNWQCDTAMHYVYVEKYGAGGDPQLCYVYNEVDTLVLGVTANVRFNSTDHTSEKLNYDVYEKRSNGIMDAQAKANAIGNAIDSYLNYSQVMHSFVSYVYISGAGGEYITRYYVCKEVYPGQLY